MGSNIMLSIYAALALIVLFLVIVVAVKTNRKVAHNTALLRAHHEAKAAEIADKESSGEGADGSEGAKSGASRNFRPSA